MADPQVLSPLPPPLAPPPSNDNSGPTTSTPQGSVPLPTPPASDTPAWATTGQNAATMTGGYAGAPTLSSDVSVQQPPPPAGQDTASGGGTKPDGSDVPKDQRAIDPTKVPQPPAQQPPYNGPPPVDPFAIGEHPEFKQHYDQMQKDLEQARAATEEANRRLIEMYKQGEFQTQRYREVMNEALENERTMTQLQNRIAMHPPTRSTNDQQVAAAGMATALASIGGRLANPTSMLTAMGAASNAAVDRNDELFKQNMEVWKTQADLVGHGAELESKLQSDAVAAAGNNSKMLLDQLTPLAQITNNTSLLHKLENGDYEAAIKQVQDYRKLAEDFPIHQVVAQAGMTAWHQIQTEEAQWSKDHSDQPVPDEVKQAIEQKAIAGYNRTVAPLQTGAEKPNYTNWEVPDPHNPGKTMTVSARPDPAGTGLIGVDGTAYPTGTKVPEKTMTGGNLEVSKEYEVIDDKTGKVIGQPRMLRERRDAPGFIDSNTGETFTPAKGQSVKQITPTTAGGGRAGAQVLRQLIGGREVLSDLQNAVSLPVGSTIGVFGNTVPGVTIRGALEADLTRHLTSQDAQLMQASMASLKRELSVLMSPVYGGAYASDQIDALIPKEGDTLGTALFKLARIAQSADNALEGASKSPLLSNDEQEFAATMRGDINTAIPWTPAQALAFAAGNHPKESFSTFVQKHGIAEMRPDWAAGRQGTVDRDGQQVPVYEDSRGNWYYGDHTPYHPAQQ